MTLIYDSKGHLALDTGGLTLAALQLDSAAGLLDTRQSNPPLCVLWESCTDTRIFHLDTSGFSDLDIGQVLPAELTPQDLLADLNIDGAPVPNGNLREAVGGGPFLFALPQPGDFNADGQLSINDINMLSRFTAMSSSWFDVDGSGSIDQADLGVLVEGLMLTWIGDANLDGGLDTTDLITSFQYGEYYDLIPGNSTWVEGDFNGDGDFDNADLVALLSSSNYECGPRDEQGDCSWESPGPGQIAEPIPGTKAWLGGFEPRRAADGRGYRSAYLFDSPAKRRRTSGDHDRESRLRFDR